MKQILSALLLFVGLTSAQAEIIPQVANITARQITSLNGEWHYIVDVQEEGYYDYRMNPTPWGFFLNAKPQHPEDLIEYDFDKAPTMQIPGDWNTQDNQLFFYEGTVWFKRSFNFSPLTSEVFALLWGHQLRLLRLSERQAGRSSYWWLHPVQHGCYRPAERG